MHSTERLASTGVYQSTSGNTQEIESTDKTASVTINAQEQKLIRQQASKIKKKDEEIKILRRLLED